MGKHIKNIWNVGDIGFILGITKAEILEVDEDHISMIPAKKSGHKGRRQLKVRYLAASYKNNIGTEMWIKRCTFAKYKRTKTHRRTTE